MRFGSAECAALRARHLKAAASAGERRAPTARASGTPPLHPLFFSPTALLAVGDSVTEHEMKRVSSESLFVHPVMD